MPEPRPRRRPRVTLCAAITFDGKLDTSNPLPPALLAALALTDADRFTTDATTAATLPSALLEKTIILPPIAWKRPGASRCLPHNTAVKRVVCLGGPRTFRALLDAGLADELLLLIRPRVDGRRAAPTLSGPPTPEFFPRSISCRLHRMEVHGGECLLHYTVVRPRTR